MSIIFRRIVQLLDCKVVTGVKIPEKKVTIVFLAAFRKTLDTTFAFLKHDYTVSQSQE